MGMARTIITAVFTSTALILLLVFSGSWAAEKSCDMYGELSGEDTIFVWLDGCYVKRGGDQYRPLSLVQRMTPPEPESVIKYVESGVDWQVVASALRRHLHIQTLIAQGHKPEPEEVGRMALQAHQDRRALLKELEKVRKAETHDNQ